MFVSVCFGYRRPALSAMLYLFGFCIAIEPALAGMFYIDGHGDIGVGYEPVDPMDLLGPKNLHPHWHLGDGAGTSVVGLPMVTDAEFEPQEITAVVPLSSKFSNPGGITWSFLGTSSGADVFFLPQNNPPGVVIPFLGIASEELEPAEWSNLIWKISLSGAPPGNFSIFSNGIFGPSILYSSLLGPSSFPTAIGSHDHFNLAFTQPGFYDLDITISGNHTIDGMKTASGTFQFFVGDISSVPEPNSTALVTSAWLIVFSRRTQRSKRRS